MSLLIEEEDEILHFDAAYGALICKPCQCAIIPSKMLSHLRGIHKKQDSLTEPRIKAMRDHFLTLPYYRPEAIRDLLIAPNTAPIPFLQLYHNGFCCLLCPATKPYTCRTERLLSDRLKGTHH